MKKVTILGGGISGLAYAWFLKKNSPDLEITILEKEDRLGGWIHTTENQGFLFEQGPRSCRPFGSGEATLALIQELGLEDDVILGEAAAHKRFLYFGNKLHSLPGGVFSLFRTPWFWPLLPALVKEYYKPAQKHSEETIEAFFTRRFNRKIADLLIDPMVSGIYAGDIRQLSLKSCFPTFYQWEQQHGSLLKGLLFAPRKRTQNPFIQKVQKSSLFTLKNGMKSLIDALQHKLEAQILLSSAAEGLSFTNKGIDIHLKGRSLQTDHIVFALPAPALARLLLPHHPLLAEKLNQIPYSSVASVQMGYHQQVLKQQGFGYLVPSSEKENILGMIWESSAFPKLNRTPEETRLSVMIGGPQLAGFDAHSQKEFKQIALEAAERHLGITQKPAFINCTLSKQAIPQYLLGHEDLVRSIEKDLAMLSPAITLLGNSFYGVSVNDCIAQARNPAHCK